MSQSQRGRMKRKNRKPDPMRQEDINRTLQHDTLLSALTISEAVDYETIADEIQTLFGTRSPVSALTEMGQYLRTSVNFVDVGLPDGPSHSPKFTMNAVVAGSPYKRVQAKNKKDCRSGAAYLAWKNIVQEEQKKFRDICNAHDTSFHDLTTALSHLEYLKLVERKPAAFCGRKILAAFLMKKKQKKGKRDIMRVVSLATGNRCILSQYLNSDGTVVNDSHAEVLARRALLRYLIKELENFKSSNPDTIYEQSSSGQARLKSSISLHLYISTAPCGDASLFSRSETELINYQGPIFTSDIQGVLRTKIESGEGAIPIEPDYSQTLVGLQFGKRLRTMSCSDKVCKWNILGVQGALLSHFLEPIYLNTITVGNNFVYGHVARALTNRLGKDQAHYEPNIFLPPPFKVALPQIGHSDLDRGMKETEHSLATCVAWNCGADTLDIFDGVRGKATEGPEAERSPSICKRMIYQEFKMLCSKLKRNDALGQTYFETKQKAMVYQKAKLSMCTRLKELGYGFWVKKPLELEYFG